MSLVETAYFVLSFASLTPLKKVVKGPQLVVVSVAVAAVAVAVVVVAVLEEEHMACLDQQHSGKEGQAVVAAVRGLFLHIMYMFFVLFGLGLEA